MKNKKFIKAANNWIKERRLVIEEDKLRVEHVNKIIDNLKKQKAVTQENIKLDKKAIRKYIADCKKEGYTVGDK